MDHIGIEIMKKIALIILLGIYSLSTFGVGIRQFYCCGKLKSTDISFVQDGKEKCGKANEKTGCCKTTFKSLKVKDTHIGAEAIGSSDKYFSAVHLIPPIFGVRAIAFEPVTAANPSHAPPFNQSTPIYIFNCVYRI